MNLNFTSGVLDKTKLFTNFLLIVLLAGNIYFSIQFIENMKRPDGFADNSNNTVISIKATRLLKTFINKVLNTQGTVSIEDRVQLENEVLQLKDPVVTATWNKFVESKTSKEAQTNAITLMSLLVDRIN